ncbi:MAG: hypothetical protein QI197_03500 [Candidatus Korarchaeota archaeon]|nr:hypothetical protein [Candidatus Korarchaeota archaeon]
MDGRSVKPIKRDRELVWNVGSGSKVIRFKVKFSDPPTRPSG